MAKIKQTKIRLELDPAKPWQETVIYTCYEGTNRRNMYGSSVPKDGRFFIKLPAVVAVSLSKEEVRAETQEKVWGLFEEAIKQFKNLSVEKHKVICYEIKVYPHPQVSYSNSGLIVSVWAGIFLETVAVAGNEARRYSYERQESSLSFPGDSVQVGFSRGRRFENQVPWTEENEKFFAWVQGRMQELVSALAAIESPDKMIETINAGRLLPLGESK